MDIIRQAYPTCGSEGYREPAFTLVQENGSALFGHAGTKYPKATAIVIDYLTNGENMRERITELLEEQ